LTTKQSANFSFRNILFRKMARVDVATPRRVCLIALFRI